MSQYTRYLCASALGPGPMNDADPFNLHRFVDAQAGGVYERALCEIEDGRKRTHWMWFIFPQLAGLGISETAKVYGIRSIEEARGYLDHELLGPRLIACAEATLSVPADQVQAVFGTPDDLKLRSSATLFAHVSTEHSVFQRLLDKFWGGEPDPRTIDLLRTDA